MSDGDPEGRHGALGHEEEHHDKQADVSHKLDHGAEYGRKAGVTQLFFCPVLDAAPGDVRPAPFDELHAPRRAALRALEDRQDA